MNDQTMHKPPKSDDVKFEKQGVVYFSAHQNATASLGSSRGIVIAVRGIKVDGSGRHTQEERDQLVWNEVQELLEKALIAVP